VAYNIHVLNVSKLVASLFDADVYVPVSVVGLTRGHSVQNTSSMLKKCEHSNVF
jgi:hypothetical protein